MAIEFHNITKTFGKTRALDQVSLTLEEGRIYGLLGNNGAGKTTLLSILTDRQRPDSGQVLVDGLPVRNNDEALSRIFLVGEQNFFPDDMKVKKALETIPLFYPSFDKDYALGLTEQFGLPLKKKLTALSTGYSSIFRLILGLSVNTPYVIFDEPVLGLDAQNRDLFYRLSTVMLELPPLREHLEDLEELVQYHLNATAYQYVHAITAVDPQVYAILRAYNWPGNVRELFHVLDYAQNVADSDTMRPEHLPSYLLKHRAAAPVPAAASAPPAIDFSTATLQSLLDDYEHQILLQALEHCGYNISRTAETLGILRQSLQYRIRKYGIVL